MKIFKVNKSLLIPLAVGVFEFVLLYLVLNFFVNKKMFISIDNVTWDNITVKFISDYCSMLLLPTILMIIYRKQLSDLGLRYESKKGIFILIAVMVILFLLHKDFTIKGIYQFFFFLVVVAFGEEFIYRGFLYNMLKCNSKIAAIILSGILWGIAHAILPSLTNSTDIFLTMLSQTGFGIIMGWYFIYLQEKSKTSWIPILVHAILDYSISFVGVFTAIGTFFYYFLRSRHQKA